MKGERMFAWLTRIRHTKHLDQTQNSKKQDGVKPFTVHQHLHVSALAKVR